MRLVTHQRLQWDLHPEPYCALPTIYGGLEQIRGVPSESVYPLQVTVTRYGSLYADLTMTIEEHQFSAYNLSFSQTTFNYIGTQPGDVFIETINVTIPAAVANTADSGGVLVTVDNGEFDYKLNQQLCLLPDEITVAPDGWQSAALHDWELTLPPASINFDGRKILEVGSGSLDQCQTALGASSGAIATCEAQYGAGSPLCGDVCTESLCSGYFDHDHDNWTISSNAFTDTVGLGINCADWYQCRFGEVLGAASCTFSIPQKMRMECPSGTSRIVQVAGPDNIGAYIDTTTIGSSSHGQQDTKSYAGGLATCTCTPPPP